MDDLISKVVAEIVRNDEKNKKTIPGDVKGRIASLIDHTLLKPEATEADIRKLHEEAIKFGFATICVNPCWVPFCVKLSLKKKVKICTVVSFPLGSDRTSVKVVQAEQAMKDGADELDMVANIGYFKDGRFDLAGEDIAAVVKAAGKVPVKVIIETCVLTDEEKIKACLTAKQAKAAFVKTSTGTHKEGARVEDVALMRKVVGAEMGVKASGGIRTLQQALDLVTAGANRLGASAGVEIVG